MILLEEHMRKPQPLSCCTMCSGLSFRQLHSITGATQLQQSELKQWRQVATKPKSYQCQVPCHKAESDQGQLCDYSKCYFCLFCHCVAIIAVHKCLNLSGWYPCEGPLKQTDLNVVKDFLQQTDLNVVNELLQQTDLNVLKDLLTAVKDPLTVVKDLLTANWPQFNHGPLSAIWLGCSEGSLTANWPQCS